MSKRDLRGGFQARSWEGAEAQNVEGHVNPEHGEAGVEPWRREHWADAGDLWEVLCVMCSGVGILPQDHRAPLNDF